MKISILTPSRGRPKELYRFFDSINSTISKQNNIYFLIGIDHDDPSRKDYYDILRSMQIQAKENVIVTMIQEERKTVGRIWNNLSRMKSWIDSSDVFIMGNDDLMYITQDWDIILEEKLLSVDHPFYCHWFDDGINGKDHCAFPIVTKYWVFALGYFVPECFRFFYHDTWIFDIAKKVNVAHFIPEVKTKHLHFSNGSSPADKTYMQWRDNETWDYDTKMFNSMETNRVAIAEILQERISNFKINRL